MDSFFKKIVWQQFGASIDALGNAMEACPEQIWNDRSRRPEFWYIAFHTLFWLDFNLSDSPEGFAPPSPFGLEEMDPAGIIPERPYTKEELQTYLQHCRKKCRAGIEALTDENANQRWHFGRVDLSRAELLLYNMRHVQHHAGQLNLILRQTLDSAPRWVFKAKDGR